MTQLPKTIQQYLYKVNGVAISNKRYRWAIDIFEKYRRKYLFTNEQKYRLAVLYDHLAMVDKRKSQEIRKAEGLYKEILQKAPSYFLAWYGMGKLYAAQRNYKKALQFQIKAYKQMLKLPRKKRGALAIGNLYVKMNNYRKAEEWFLREYRNCPKNDFGTALNLFNFYKQNGDIKKAFHYGLIVRKLIKSEYRKEVYKGLNMQNSDFLKYIRRQLNEVIKKK